jgi:hypothetical protein
MAQRLLDERDQAFLFRNILRLDDEAPLPIGPAQTKLSRPEAAALWQGLDEYSLRAGLGQSLLGAMETYVG